MNLKVLSYNIHKCIGVDGQHQPKRIADFLKETNADMVALQEVEVLKDGGGDLLSYVAKEKNFEFIPGPTMYYEASHYGNALLIRKNKFDVLKLNLSYKNREPRGAICVTQQFKGKSIQLLGTHLGLSPRERRFQVKKILQTLQKLPNPDIRILCGDINEWVLWGRPLKWLHKFFSRPPFFRTFPTSFPFLALDRIWVSPLSNIVTMYPVKNKVTRYASDHYPLMAEIKV